MHLKTSILLYNSIFFVALVARNYQNTQAQAIKKVDYETFKKNVIINKNLLINKPSKTVSNYLFKLVNDDIYNYWQGTPWAFYGKTQQPKVGNIACGYFVTNTLTDLGFKINRIDLAEGLSGDMIKKLCVNIKSFNSLKKLDSYLAQQPVNSVFIIGLDFHTGYVIKTASGCYFMHSYYLNNIGVIKEKIDESEILSTNKFFMIGSLTANNMLLQKWVGNRVIN